MRYRRGAPASGSIVGGRGVNMGEKAMILGSGLN